METTQEFEILIRRRIPFFSSLLISAAFFFFVVLFILYLLMLPSRLSSLEMKTSYFILAIPNVLKQFCVYSIMGLPITVWLYYSLRLYRPAILSFHSKAISIAGKQLAASLFACNINCIKFNRPAASLNRCAQLQPFVRWKRKRRKPIITSRQKLPLIRPHCFLHFLLLS
jgi:hypothetical protein